MAKKEPICELCVKPLSSCTCGEEAKKMRKFCNKRKKDQISMYKESVEYHQQENLKLASLLWNANQEIKRLKNAL